MKTTYKGYEIDNCTGDRFIIRLNGEYITTIQGSLSCARFAIDSDYEDMTLQPVKYDDLHLSIESYKLSGGYVKIEAECESTNKWYNVFIPYSDIEFSLDIEEGQLETYSMDDNATDGICTAANDIYERYCTGTTTYDIVFEKQKKTIDTVNYKCYGREYKVLAPLSPYFGKTMKETSILSIQGKTEGVCFEVLQGGEWSEVSFLFSELEEIK